MKKFPLLVFLILFFTLQAQTYTIPKSTGDLLGVKTLWDKEKIFGYIEVHNDGLKDKIQNISYIILDQDFKKISEGKFSQKKITGGTFHLGTCLYNNGKVLIDFDEYIFGKSIYMNDTFVIVDVATGISTDSKTLQNGSVINTSDFVPENKEFPILNYSYKISNVQNVGFLFNEAEKRGAIGFYKNAILVDFDGKKLWQNKEYTPESKDHFYEYTPFASDEETVFLFSEYYKKRKSISDNMLLLDTKTGKELYFNPIAEKDYLLNYKEAKIIENHIYLVGEYFKKNQNLTDNNPTLENKLGLYRYKIDKKTGEIISKDFLPFKEMLQFVDINENGRIKKEGVLLIRSFEIRPDGSNVIVAETYRPESILAINTYTELFSILLNNEFKIEKMESHNVNNTAGSKYAYTQILPDNSGVSSIFITNEVNQEKIIFLNEILYNDVNKSFETKKMQIQKNDEDKYFFPAKPDYIVLKEEFYWGKAKKLNKQAEFTLKKIEAN